MSKDRHYINDFLRMNCAGDILNAGVCTDLSGIARAMSIFDGVVGLSLPLKDAGTTAVIREAGARPDVAALIAFLTRWTVVAVGPNLRAPTNFGTINRLTVIPHQEAEVIADGPIVSIDATGDLIESFHQKQTSKDDYAQRSAITTTSRWHAIPRLLGDTPSLQIDLAPYGYHRTLWGWRSLQ